MKLPVSLVGTIFGLGGLAAKQDLAPDKVAADIKTEAWVALPLLFPVDLAHST